MTGYITGDIHVWICILKMPFHLQDCSALCPTLVSQGCPEIGFAPLTLWVLPSESGAVGAELPRKQMRCNLVLHRHSVSFMLHWTSNVIIWERETIPILKSIYFSETTHIPLCPNWYLLIMCTTQGVTPFQSSLMFEYRNKLCYSLNRGANQLVLSIACSPLSGGLGSLLLSPY